MLPAANDVIKLRQPMITFVAHFDGDSDGICESVGLAVGRNGGPHVQNVVVLTSPTNHIYRKRAYHVRMHALCCGCGGTELVAGPVVHSATAAV